MPRLKVQEIATQKGKRLSELQIDARLPMATMRRYWYGTKDGKAVGEPLNEVGLDKLAAIAAALDVRIADLIDEWLALQPASGLGTFHQL
jgi:DNA-binding Xre family transcriptional regulator